MATAKNLFLYLSYDGLSNKDSGELLLALLMIVNGLYNLSSSSFVIT